MLRRFADKHDKATMDTVAESGARGEDGIKEFSVTYKGIPLNVCVASGLANARTVMENIKSGKKHYHGMPQRMYHGRRTASESRKPYQDGKK